MSEKIAPDVRFKKDQRDWKSSEFGKEIEIGSASRVHKNEWTDSGVPFFRTSDVVSDFYASENKRAFISYELYEELAKQSGRVQKNDLLVTGGGSIGIPYLVKSNEPLYFKDGDLLWFKNKDRLDGYFTFTFFSTSFFREYLKGISHSGTISHYTIEQAKATPIRLPEKPIQKLIGEHFEQVDHLISLHSKKYEKLLNVKKAMLEKMFPKDGTDVPEIRFKGFTDKWNTIRLGDQSIIKGRLGWKSLKQKEYLDEGPAMIAGKHISDGVIDWSIVDHIPQWRYDESPEIMLKEGDVIFSKDGSLGNPAVVKNLNCLATINSTMMLVRLKKEFSPYYFYQVLKSSTFDRLIKMKVSGSSIPHLFQADMKEFIFQAPSYDEQKKIGAYLGKLDDLISAQNTEIEKLKNIKKAMLKKMFA